MLKTKMANKEDIKELLGMPAKNEQGFSWFWIFDKYGKTKPGRVKIKNKYGASEARVPACSIGVTSRKRIVKLITLWSITVILSMLFQ